MVLRRTVVHASAVLLVEAGWAALAMQGSHNARWKDIRTKKGNDRCADCSSRDTTWVVLDYGILVCINCAASHRALGTHISKVRSTELDRFADPELDWIFAMGNDKSNSVWEASVPSGMRRPVADAPDCIRRRWLRAKYDEQQFVDGNVHPSPLPHQQCAGWLLKQGNYLPTWRRRYFSIMYDRLYYFLDNTCSTAALRGYFELANLTVHTDPDEDPLCVRLSNSHGGARLLTVKASSQQEAEKWVWALYHCVYSATQLGRRDLATSFARRRPSFKMGSLTQTAAARRGSAP